MKAPGQQLDRTRRTMIALVAAIIAITLGVVVFADELVREGRYVLLDDTDQTISVHNELHVAIREGQD